MSIMSKIIYTGIHKKLKIIFASSFKVYSELGGFFNFRYNISFLDPPLGGFGGILLSVMIFSSGQSPSENIITSGNIPPNPPRSGSINDKNTAGDFIKPPRTESMLKFIKANFVITAKKLANVIKTIQKQLGN